MTTSLVDPNRLRRRLEEIEKEYGGSVKRGMEIAFELATIADSVNRLSEYFSKLNEALCEPPSLENLDRLTTYLAFIQVELYEQLLDHAEELKSPLMELMAHLDPYLEKLDRQSEPGG